MKDGGYHHVISWFLINGGFHNVIRFLINEDGGWYHNVIRCFFDK